MRINFDLHIASGKSHREPPTDALMETTPTLRFTIEYPLTNPFEFSETHSDGRGWTQKEFADAVRRGYTQVYESDLILAIFPACSIVRNPKVLTEFGVTIWAISCSKAQSVRMMVRGAYWWDHKHG